MRLSHFISVIAAAAMSACMLSCSEDGPSKFNGTIDTDHLESLSRGEESATYSAGEVHCYNKDALTNGKWEEFNPAEYDGFSTGLPREITIHDGRTWLELPMFHLAGGPSRLSMPLAVYRKVTGFDKEFYIAAPVVFDNVKSTLSINGMTFNVKEATENHLTLSYISPYVGGRTHEGGEHLYIQSYVKTDLVLPDIDNILFYDSEKEARLAIADMLIEEFGEKLDLNQYLYPQVILDEPIVDLANLRNYIQNGGF